MFWRVTVLSSLHWWRFFFTSSLRLFLFLFSSFLLCCRTKCLQCHVVEKVSSVCLCYCKCASLRRTFRWMFCNIFTYMLFPRFQLIHFRFLSYRVLDTSKDLTWTASWVVLLVLLKDSPTLQLTSPPVSQIFVNKSLNHNSLISLRRSLVQNFAELVIIRRAHNEEYFWPFLSSLRMILQVLLGMRNLFLTTLLIPKSTSRCVIFFLEKSNTGFLLRSHPPKKIGGHGHEENCTCLSFFLPLSPVFENDMFKSCKELPAWELVQ